VSKEIRCQFEGNPVSVHHSSPKRRTDTGLPRKDELRPDYPGLPRKDELTPDYRELTPDYRFKTATRLTIFLVVAQHPRFLGPRFAQEAWTSQPVQIACQHPSTQGIGDQAVSRGGSAGYGMRSGLPKASLTLAQMPAHSLGTRIAQHATGGRPGEGKTGRH
jgi:hypothetical protein